jgi:hypothetical protein
MDPLLAASVTAGEALVGGYRETRYRLPADGQITQFRILSQMINDSYFVCNDASFTSVFAARPE